MRARFLSDLQSFDLFRLFFAALSRGYFFRVEERNYDGYLFFQRPLEPGSLFSQFTMFGLDMKPWTSLVPPLS